MKSNSQTFLQGQKSFLIGSIIIEKNIDPLKWVTSNKMKHKIISNTFC